MTILWSVISFGNFPGVDYQFTKKLLLGNLICKLTVVLIQTLFGMCTQAQRVLHWISIFIEEQSKKYFSQQNLARTGLINVTKWTLWNVFFLEAGQSLWNNKYLIVTMKNLWHNMGTSFCSMTLNSTVTIFQWFFFLDFAKNQPSHKTIH